MSMLNIDGELRVAERVPSLTFHWNKQQTVLYCQTHRTHGKHISKYWESNERKVNKNA